MAENFFFFDAPKPKSYISPQGSILLINQIATNEDSQYLILYAFVGIKLVSYAIIATLSTHFLYSYLCTKYMFNCVNYKRS